MMKQKSFQNVVKLTKNRVFLSQTTRDRYINNGKF